MRRQVLGGLGIWLLILATAFLNGALRELVLLPALGKLWAPLLSGVLLCACILAISGFLVPRLGALSRRQALLMGVAWLGLTLAFEFSFGRFVQHKEWPELFGAYTFQDGNIWTLVLAVVLGTPLWARSRKPLVNPPRVEPA